jgi:SAM-dependent methyltransferase
VSLSVPLPSSLGITRKRVKRVRKNLPTYIASLLRLDPFSGGRQPGSLTRTQQLFIEWNAERMGVSFEEARERYLRSWSQVRGGHRRQAYNRFCEAAHEIFSVFHADSEGEVYEAYRFHAKMHFLRMLSRKEPVWSDADPLVRGLSGRDEVRILDYGCGLCQPARGLAELLLAHGRRVHLTLADIPTVRKSFLVWLCQRTGIPADFLDCTEERPIPPLPRVDLAFANDVFEHLHEPEPVFEAIEAALEPGGFLVTDLEDHLEGFMHVTPDLASLHRSLEARGYREIRKRRVYQKPALP